MEKVEKDGKVAVIHAQCAGTGWSTQCSEHEQKEIMMFHPDLVEMVLANSKHDAETNGYGNPPYSVEDLEAKASELTGDQTIVLIDHTDLIVTWVLSGLIFMLTNVDGSECITSLDDLPLHTA